MGRITNLRNLLSTVEDGFEANEKEGKIRLEETRTYFSIYVGVLICLGLSCITSTYFVYEAVFKTNQLNPIVVLLIFAAFILDFLCTRFWDMTIACTYDLLSYLGYFGEEAAAALLKPSNLNIWQKRIIIYDTLKVYAFIHRGDVSKISEKEIDEYVSKLKK